MIKIILFITKWIVAILTALIFGACYNHSKGNTIYGSNIVTVEKRVVKEKFTSITVSSSIELIVEQSDQTEIIVKADDNLQDGITTQVDNGVLSIRCKYGSFVNVASKQVIVKLPIIDELKASSAASIKSKGTIKSNSIAIAVSSAATIKATIESEEIFCESSSAGNVYIEGKAIRFQVNASSASDINAEKLLANAIKVDASSGAEVRVHPLVQLEAEASSGGNIVYSNTPKTIQRETSSGGSISSN